MVLSLSISSETEAKLKAKAAAAGVDLATYAAKALDRVATRHSLDEVLAPLRAQFDQSGMSEDQLTTLLETTKHEARTADSTRRPS